MAPRRVLVFDNDRDFLTLLHSSLAGYGFEIQVLEPAVDQVHRIKEVTPEVLFIAVDLPDKVGYTLCTRAKKIVGIRTPVFLTTATLPPEDMALHAKQKLHADVYLDKRGLTRDRLLQRLRELIRLKPQGPPPQGGKAPEPSTGGEALADRQDEPAPPARDPAAGEPPAMPEAPAEPEAKAKPTDDEAAWISELLDEVIEAKDDEDFAYRVATAKTDGPVELVGADDDASLAHQLFRQESEIRLLRRELDEERRHARSSPFSGDFLKLREITAQKDREILDLNANLHVTSQEILTGRQKLREVARRLLAVKREKSESTEREQALT
ncbi:MAG: response regulator, partial [bacterium]|nr:response regulator [bacterium]